MIQPGQHIYVQTAIEAIEAFVLHGKRLKPPAKMPEQLQIRRACFVSLHQLDEALRGCIGTIEPRHEDLFHEIVENGISAASRDPRFTPVKKKELTNLKVSVDVLTLPEKTKPQELDPFQFGLIISDGFRKGVLLPNLEGVDTVEKQINIVKKKAGLNLVPNDELSFFRFESKRYE